jgi:hypothetical protein
MKIDKKSLNSINEVMTQYGNLEESLGIDSIQSERFMRDYRVGAKIGVVEMNENNHGWDGYFKNGVPFENKNVKVTSKSAQSFSLKFQDTSMDKLTEMTTKPVIVTTSLWDRMKSLGFLVVGNTQNVGDRLLKSYNPETRRSSTVSLPVCIANGFKIVAIDYTKQQVIDIITEKFPRLGKSLTPSDIYTEKEVKSLVKSMMA